MYQFWQFQHTPDANYDSFIYCDWNDTECLTLKPIITLITWEIHKDDDWATDKRICDSAFNSNQVVINNQITGKIESQHLPWHRVKI